MGNLHDWIEYAAKFIEVMAVVMMLGFIMIGTVKWLFFSGRQIGKAYGSYRLFLGKALLVGIELLVAADIIRTVVLEATMQNIATLGLLVLVRTFLGWTLTVEVEGRWPWQRKQAEEVGTRLFHVNKTVPAGVTGDEKERGE